MTNSEPYSLHLTLKTPNLGNKCVEVMMLIFINRLMMREGLLLTLASSASKREVEI